MGLSGVEPDERLRVIIGPQGYELHSDRGLGGFFSWLPSEFPDAEAVTWDGRWAFRRLGPRGWKIVGFEPPRSGDQAAALADAPVRYRRRTLQPGGAIDVDHARSRLTKQWLRRNRWWQRDSDGQEIARIRSNTPVLTDTHRWRLASPVFVDSARRSDRHRNPRATGRPAPAIPADRLLLLGAAGVGDVTGERGDRAGLFEAWNAGDMDAFRELYDPDAIMRWLRIGRSRGRTSAGRRSCASRAVAPDVGRRRR